MPDLTPENAELLAEAVQRPGVAAAAQVHGEPPGLLLAAMRNADQLADDVTRLQAENRRLRDRNADLERMLLEWKASGGPPSRHRNRAARFEAVIEKVRELHSPTPSVLAANGPEDYCAHCGEAWPCPTAALLPDPDDAEDARAARQAIAEPGPSIALADLIARHNDQETT